MPLLAETPLNVAGQVAAAVLLAAAGVFFMLPRPRGRSLAVGVFLCLAAAAVAVAFLANAFGDPSADVLGQVLFWLFAGASVTFGIVLVVQRNPARGAIAFAFVILSSCGLFLLLAAPFLMAATIIIYMGAIIVTFLFVLMLSDAKGPSDENDRSREPLLGSFAGFAFTGLVLFTLYLSKPTDTNAFALPAPPFTADDRANLAAILDDLKKADAAATATDLEPLANAAHLRLGELVGYAPGEVAPAEVLDATPRVSRGTIQERLRIAETDPRVWQIIGDADKLRTKKKDIFATIENGRLDGKLDLAKAKADLRGLRDEVMLLAGRGELPARNVSAIGYALYSEHLLAVEMAGTLLLVATIGAVAIAQRKGAA